MADLGKTMREAWIKSMESISNAAKGLASNTRYKVEELNLQSRRRELLGGFGAMAYELWKKGERFPAEAEKLLQELNDVDEALKALEAEKQERAQVKEDEESEEIEETEETAEEQEAPAISYASGTEETCMEEMEQSADEETAQERQEEKTEVE